MSSSAQGRPTINFRALFLCFNFFFPFFIIFFGGKIHLLVFSICRKVREEEKKNLISNGHFC